MGSNIPSQKPKAKQPDYYTLSYNENGKTQKINVEKGIKIKESKIKSGANGFPDISFKTSGTKNVTLPKLSAAEISILKTYEMADGKKGLTKDDIKKLYDVYQDGRLTPYVNHRAPKGVKEAGFNPTNNNSPSSMSIDVKDSNTKKNYGFDVTSSGQ